MKMSDSWVALYRPFRILLLSSLTNLVLTVMVGAEQQYAQWPQLGVEKVVLLPLSPVPRGPTIKEYIHGTYRITPGGPARALVKGKRIYVVDDVKRILLECSPSGEVLRRLAFPGGAPEGSSAAMALRGETLWIGLEHSAYAFAVNLKQWIVVRVRSLERKGFMKRLFAGPDDALYAIIGRGGATEAQWEVVRISSDGKQESQAFSGWQPEFVDAAGGVYWILKASQSAVEYAYARFAKGLRSLATLRAQDVGGVSVSLVSDGIISADRDYVWSSLTPKFKGKEPGVYPMVDIIVKVTKTGQIEVFGKEPVFKRPIRSLELPRWFACEGQLYSIMREDVGDFARFWLVRLREP